jgi:hypothetical protein
MIAVRVAGSRSSHSGMSCMGRIRSRLLAPRSD